MKEKAPRTDGAGEHTPERDHRRSRTAYPTDLANAEWTRLRSCLPEPNPAGRPRRHCLRETLCDLLRSQDRLSLEALSHDFPPWQTVFNHFRRFRLKGSWHRIR